MKIMFYQKSRTLGAKMLQVESHHSHLEAQEEVPCMNLHT